MWIGVFFVVVFFRFLHHCGLFISLSLSASFAFALLIFPLHRAPPVCIRPAALLSSLACITDNDCNKSENEDVTNDVQQYTGAHYALSEHILPCISI